MEKLEVNQSGWT